jgi:sulfate adenylyltransferase
MVTPHGGKLVNREVPDHVKAPVASQMAGLPAIDVPEARAVEVENIAKGVVSPLEGFMGREDVDSVVHRGRLADDTPWTIPIILDVGGDEAARFAAGDDVALVVHGRRFAVLHVTEMFSPDRESMAREVYGTTDAAHPGVRQMQALGPVLVAGPVDLVEGALDDPFSRFALAPKETRVLFRAKGWRTIVGFQTRNVPHLGHEYVQKTALTFTDGLFINPVIGPKKPGDFKDDVLLAAYEVLVKHYYLRERAVLAVLRTQMRYAGPREAIFHAILRKNFGCTHFVVGRDHAGVGSFYSPYASQEIFDKYPELGITPLFFTAFFYCRRCGAVANEKICPHGEADRIQFSGTGLRNALAGTGDVTHLIRPEVAEIVQRWPDPFVSPAEARS